MYYTCYIRVFECSVDGKLVGAMIWLEGGMGGRGLGGGGGRETLPSSG